MELARDPVGNGPQYGSGNCPSYLPADELASGYQHDVWTAKVLNESGLIPADLEEHLVQRHLRGDTHGVNFSDERSKWIHKIYGEWRTGSTGRPVGAMQYQVLNDKIIESDATFKDCTRAAIHALGLRPDPLSEPRLKELRSTMFAMLDAAAEEFSKR